MKTDNEQQIRKAYKFIIFAVLSLCIACGFGFLAMKSHLGTAKQISENGSIDYGVELKENGFYEKDYIEHREDGATISSFVGNLIKKIDLDFDYDLSSDGLSGDLEYKIIADLSIKNSDTNELFYNKKFDLIDPKTISLDTDGAKISEKVEVDYDYYNNLAKQFLTFGVNPTSTLTVRMDISKNIDLEDYEVDGYSSADSLKISIPLTTNTVSVMMEASSINRSTSLKNDALIGGKILAFLVIGGLFVGAAVVFAIEAMLKFHSAKAGFNEYDAKLYKILNEYDRLIVTSETAPVLEEYDVKIVNSFDELLDARDGLHRPIDFYEKRAHQMAYFYVRIDKEMYLYILSEAAEKRDK